MKTHQCFICGLFLVLLAGVSCPRSVRGYTVSDTQEALTWDELLHSKRIIVASAEPIADDRVRLHVQKVLAGDGIKAGADADVALAHWYGICWHDMSRIKQSDLWAYERRGFKGHDEMVYRYPGEGGQGCSPDDHFGDMHQASVYFFPSGKLELDHFGQVQLSELTSDCEAAINPGGKPSVYLRIMQGSPVMRMEAIEEVRKTRDPQTLDRLFAWMFDAPEYQGYSQAEEILTAIGDVKGDVTLPLVKKFDAATKAIPQQYVGEPARIAAMLDPELGFEAFSKRAVDGPAEEYAIAALAWAPSQKCLDFILERLQKGDHARQWEDAVERMLLVNTNRGLSYPKVSRDAVRELRAGALPSLRAAAALPGLIDVKPKLDEMIRRIESGDTPARPSP